MNIGNTSFGKSSLAPRFGKMTVEQMERTLKSPIPTFWDRATLIRALDSDIIRHGTKTNSTQDQENTLRLKEALEEFMLNKPPVHDPIAPSDKTLKAKTELAGVFAQILLAEKYAPKDTVFDGLMKEFEALA